MFSRHSVFSAYLAFIALLLQCGIVTPWTINAGAVGELPIIRVSVGALLPAVVEPYAANRAQSLASAKTKSSDATAAEDLSLVIETVPVRTPRQCNACLKPQLDHTRIAQNRAPPRSSHAVGL